MLSLIHSCPGHSSSGVNGGAKMSPKGPRGLCLMASAGEARMKMLEKLLNLGIPGNWMFFFFVTQRTSMKLCLMKRVSPSSVQL